MLFAVPVMGEERAECVEIYSTGIFYLNGVNTSALEAFSQAHALEVKLRESAKADARFALVPLNCISVVAAYNTTRTLSNDLDELVTLIEDEGLIVEYDRRIDKGEVEF